MNNSEILQRIVELRTEIEEQTNLCSNIFKLSAEPAAINEVIESTELKIDQLKDYQAIINRRNFGKTVIFRDVTFTVADLIKLKEGLLLKKQLKAALINTKSEESEMVQISLEAFQSIQDYKKSLGEIHTILEKFNNEPFNTKD